MRIKATARVRLTIDIPLTDTWGSDCAIDQIQKQAKEGALGMIRNSQFHELKLATIIGEPVVTAVLVEEQR